LDDEVQVGYNSPMFAKSSIALIGIILLLFVQPATAGQLEDGALAAERHDYVTALRLLRPLAEAGNPKAEVYFGSIYTYYIKDLNEALKWCTWFCKNASRKAALVVVCG
jgi:hypothetical protein